MSRDRAESLPEAAHRASLHRPAAFLALLTLACALGLSGCMSAAGQRPTAESMESSSSEETAIARTEIPWQDECLLSAAEVTNAVEERTFAASEEKKPGNITTGAYACNYLISDAAAEEQAKVTTWDHRGYGTGSVGIAVRWYSETANEEHPIQFRADSNEGRPELRPVTLRWTTPDADSAAQNSCASYADQFPADQQPICTPINEVPVVVSPGRAVAFVFPPGEVFYEVLLYTWNEDRANRERSTMNLVTLLTTRHL
ncbi:hypothetical protein F8O07_05650 [Pseudoclavibacter sp. CFCC 13796]|uniref:hypothetical protein n=1 Tax=Pseudoclavibacter sp. CFCC 13796 TaxID=2615179 RepID=UPI001300FD3C|nr:hypothetical protein [Pseudoclavibacter sp. CFCC 13796]KAB1661401.1 hypothetical protein F8O07_05650 [Pseudoclavibacter sp. CFCC 13796]